MAVNTKRKILVTIGIVISIVLLWLIFRNIHYRDLYEALQDANYWWLLPNIIFIVLTMYQRAYRWQTMLNPIEHVPFSKVIAATSIGFMANNVLPLRLGEFVRAYSLSANNKQISKSASLATIFVERMVFDLVALLLIMGGVFYVSELSINAQMVRGMQIAVGIAILGILFIIILAVRPQKTAVLMTRYLFFFPDTIKKKIQAIVERFSEGLQFLSSVTSVVSVGGQTMLIWLLMGFSNVFVFKVFEGSLGTILPLDAAYTVLVFVSLSILVPSSPGFVGVYHAGATLALMRYLPDDKFVVAGACALVLHATQYIVVTLMGFYYLKKEHLSLKKLGEEATDESDQ